MSAEHLKKAEDVTDMCRVYETLAAELRSWGDIAGAAYTEKQRGKERRRARELGMEDPALVRALIAEKTLGPQLTDGRNGSGSNTWNGNCKCPACTTTCGKHGSG